MSMFTIHDIKLTDEQLANLNKLAAFLESGQIPPPKFDISSYLSPDKDAHITITDDGRYGSEHCIYIEDTAAVLLETNNMTVYSACGTTACAVGHGPLAGIDVLPRESWKDYELRAFGVSQSEYGLGYSAWKFMFGGVWASSPYSNTAKGTALRIRWFLNGNAINTDQYDWELMPEFDGRQPWFDGIDLSTFPQHVEIEE